MKVKSLPNEIWKEIDDTNGQYFISTKYRIKAVKKYGERLREPILDINNGYYKFVLCVNGVTRTKKFHRLLAIAFIENPNNYPCVNHIDSNPKNNKLENLEWCTYSHNNQHAYNAGRMNKKGENNSSNKLTNKSVIKIYSSLCSTNDLSIKYNVTPSAIRQIKNGKRWSHVTENQKF